MPWQQVSPILWQRPLGENERMIKWIGDRAHPSGREQWSVTAVAAFTVHVHSHVHSHRPGPGRTDDLEIGSSGSSPSIESLRRAWIRLRFAHPGMATRAGTDTLEYMVPDAPSLEQWTNETFFIISDPTITVSGLIADCIKPSPFVTGYFLPHTQQFVLHTAHWRADGPGALQLLNALFNALASELADSDAYGKELATQLAWGDEPERLPPSIEEALDLPVDPTPEIRTATAACLATGRLVAGSIGLPYRGSAEAMPGATHWIRRPFSHEESAAIIAACRENGLRPLAAVHASLAAANVAGSGSVGGSSISSAAASTQTVAEPHYTSTMRFSLRPYLLPQFAFAVPALFTGNYMSAISASSSWWDTAARYETLYAEGLSREFLMARRQFAHEALEMLQRIAAVKAPLAGVGVPPPRSEIDMSSVDKAEEFIAPLHYGRKPGFGEEDEADMPAVQVESIGLGVECLAMETYLFFWEFKGRLELNLTYNEAFYEDDFMKKMLDVVEESLVTGLGIKLLSGG